MDYSIRRHQKGRQIKTKSRAGWSKATTRVEGNLIRITRNSDCSKYHCTTMGKIFEHPLWGEDSVKLAYMAEFLPRNHCWGSKTISEGSSGPRCTKTGK